MILTYKHIFSLKLFHLVWGIYDATIIEQKLVTDWQTDTNPQLLGDTLAGNNYGYEGASWDR